MESLKKLEEKWMLNQRKHGSERNKAEVKDDNKANEEVCFVQLVNILYITVYLFRLVRLPTPPKGEKKKKTQLTQREKDKVKCEVNAIILNYFS